MCGLLLSAVLLPAALILDRLFGEPPVRWHPVCWMGRAIDFWEGVWRRRADPAGKESLRLRGFCAMLSVQISFALPVLALAALADFLHPLAGFAVAALCGWICLAPRSLAEHARIVQRALAKGDLPAARRGVGMICGRDPQRLSAEAAARACVESVAENSSDGVLATLFWAFAGSLLAGFPGAALFPVLQRAANTMDGMWGYKNEKYRYFGTAAALTDDLFNWIPARLTFLCTVAACRFVEGADAASAWRSGLIFHSAHESPNSAWGESAYAGALGLRLGGPSVYGGRIIAHPWMGFGTPEAGPEHIDRAVRLMLASAWTMAAVLSLILLAGGLCL